MFCILFIKKSDYEKIQQSKMLRSREPVSFMGFIIMVLQMPQEQEQPMTIWLQGLPVQAQMEIPLECSFLHSPMWVDVKSRTM